MSAFSRVQQFRELFPDAPAFRLRQIEEALFSPAFGSFLAISSLPKEMRETAENKLSWMAISPVRVLESVNGDTCKAVVETADGKRIETVLMKNARGHFTVCLSSQVGCAMACTFCATGTMGLIRNLSSDEIVDQYRFWSSFLRKGTTLSSTPRSLRLEESQSKGGSESSSKGDKRSIEKAEGSQYISNIVFMGMGEPLANYENVKEALRVILKYTDIGPTRITVSTVGLLPMLKHLLSDPEWPPVRLAVSLHSADSDTRKRMMPSSFDGFLDGLADWSEEYFKKFDSPAKPNCGGAKRRHLTFEYVMLAGVNDTAMHAEALIRFARRIGKARVNLIPYNFTGDTYRGSLPGDFARFEDQLKNAGIDATRRRSMGDDIAAACGQLIVEKKES